MLFNVAFRRVLQGSVEGFAELTFMSVFYTIKEQLFDRAVMFRSQDTSARNSICFGSSTEERQRSHPNLQVQPGPSAKSWKKCRDCG